MSIQSNRRARRAGVAAFYLITIMVALCGICSLGVDLGRVQLVKTELRRAADAAARAAASSISDPTAATNLAVSFAALNRADGQPVTLDPAGDVEFGTWNRTTRTFTTLTGSARSNGNAVRVTARRTTARGNATPLLFAQVLGANTCDTSAVAIAAVEPPPRPPGVVGIEGITMKGGDRIDSYDSRNGSYASQAPNDDVVVASDGPIRMNGSCQINGDVRYLDGNAPPSGSISGTIEPSSEPLEFPAPTLPSSYTSHGNITLGGGQSLTLTAGNHYCNNLRMSGSSKLIVTGAVKLYVQGSFNMDGNSTIAVAGNKPADLQIFVLGAGPVELARNDLYASIYAPLAPVTMNGSCTLLGSVIARTLTMTGSNVIHYDEALAVTPTGPRRIVLVK